MSSKDDPWGDPLCNGYKPQPRAKSSAAARCADCGAVLTAEESEYYEFRCEKCERTAFEEFEMSERQAAPPKPEKAQKQASGKTIGVITRESGGKIYAYMGKFAPYESGLTIGEIIEGLPDAQTARLVLTDIMATLAEYERQESEGNDYDGAGTKGD